MKTRADFVSNSSSSSFIVSINKDYPTSLFSKDLAECSVNEKSRYHDSNLQSRNNMILDFCLNTYELLFLGELTLETREVIESKEQFIQKFVEDYPDEFITEAAIQEWDSNVKMIEKAKQDSADKWIKQYYGRNYIDANGNMHSFFDICISNKAVNSDTMHYVLFDCDLNMDDESRKKSMRMKVERLLEFSKILADPEKDMFFPNIECYQITKNTVKNTKAMLEYGCKLSLEGFLDLNDIEKRLESGQKIFAINTDYQGNGYNNYSIYVEDDADGLRGVAAEILTSEVG